MKKQLRVPNPLLAEATTHFLEFKKTSSETIIYEYVGLELESGLKNIGLYTKCFADAKGNSDRAQADYIRKRVKQVKAVYKSAMKLEHKNSTSNGVLKKDRYPELTMDQKIAKMRKILDELN